MFLIFFFKQTLLLCILRSVLPTVRNRNIHRREHPPICDKRMLRGLLHGHSILRLDHHQLPHEINQIRIHILHLRLTSLLLAHSLFNRRLRHAHRVYRTHARTPRNVVRRPAARLLFLGDFPRDWRRPEQIALLVEHRRGRRVQFSEHGRRNAA